MTLSLAGVAFVAIFGALVIFFVAASAGGVRVSQRRANALFVACLLFLVVGLCLILLEIPL
jgi:hypothetical protein